MLGSILLMCFCNAQTNAQLSVYPSEIYDVLFGDITSFKNKFPLEDGFEETEVTEKTVKQDNASHTRDPILFKYNISQHASHPDMLDYHVITEKANNITRRWDYEDQHEGNYFLKLFGIGYLENKKKYTLSRVNIQWLMHTRYFVSRALRQREPIRQDKRFQLGYLFNRLRRLSYEQVKILSHAEYYANYEYRSVNVYMRFYERMVRLDVDIRDTIDLIRATYVKPANYDKVVAPP